MRLACPPQSYLSWASGRTAISNTACCIVRVASGGGGPLPLPLPLPLLIYLLPAAVLSEWRQEEEERINASLSGAERKAALCLLLEQQTQLIASIGRHKLDSDTENREKRIMSFLNKVRAARDR
jgi:hypothetical protein